MKKKSLILTIPVCAMLLAYIFGNSPNGNRETAIEEVEALTGCESVGWKNNNGNCVKNANYEYFC